MIRHTLITIICSAACATPCAAESPWKLSVRVDKVVYRPGAPGNAKITIAAPENHRGPLVVKGRLEYGLDQHVDLPELKIEGAEFEPLTMPFTAPAAAWGCALVVKLFREDTLVAKSQDIFAAGTDHFRLGQQNNHGGTIAKEAVRLFQGEDGYWPTKWRDMKGTWLEIFGGLPSEVCGLTTDWDQWVTMQGKYRMSRDGIRAYTTAAHRLGLTVMMYNNATPSGSVGTAWGRKHPEWLSYNYMGAMRGDLRVQDIESRKAWHRTMAPEAEISAFEPFYLNFGDRKLVEFGCDQMLAACRDFGYDGVRFDGHWILGDVAGGLGYDMAGHRPNRGESPDVVSARILRQVREYTRHRKSDFAIGFNYGDHYERGGARNPAAYRMACADGGMILWEGATFNHAYSNWRIGAAKLRENALRVHQNGGIHYGQNHMSSTDSYPCNDFSLRYYYITNFAATSHIYSGVYPGHPKYRPIQGLYYRFALRYGDLLYAENLRPVQDPGNHLTVRADGGKTADLWWTPYTYKRQLNGKYQLITHLVNMPADDVTKQNSTPDKQPAPLANVAVQFAKRPDRVFLLDPEEEPWLRPLGSVPSLQIPELKSWKIVVQEFTGTCDAIPVEVIPELSLRGKDRAPDVRDGRIVFPITLFPSGAVCARLVQDDRALFGVALRCHQAETLQPIHRVLQGPNQSMPNTAPGRLRVVFRLKVTDNSRASTVCTLQGRFGSHAITADAFAEPGTFQEFSYEYNLQEGTSNYVYMDYHGGTDLSVDAVVIEQLSVTPDRDLFAPQSLKVTDRTPRRGSSKKAHILRGLWHDFFGFDEAARRAAIECTSSWETLSTDHPMIPVDFPATVEALLEHDLVALLNVSADSLKPVRRKHLREYVLRGGTLFVGGGPRAFGHGGYEATFLEELLPVQSVRFDLSRAEGETQRIQPAADDPFTRGVSFATRPRVVYYHKARAKTGADVILNTQHAPILTRWKLGHGTVYAFTGTPCGDIEGGLAWWQWDGWDDILDRILAGASPGKQPTYTAGVGGVVPLAGKIAGTGNLTLVGGSGNALSPLESQGVRATAQGISFGYDQPQGAQGVLAYPKGLIKPVGSITFKITPGWETELSELDRSVTLFSTQSDAHGGVFQIYVYVHSSENYALAVHVHTNEIGNETLVGHSAMYAIKRAPVGSGNSLLKTSIWKKGTTRTIQVAWSPSQLVVTENGETMAVSDFAPEMDLSSFTGPLYIGSSQSKRLSCVRLKDIEIRGIELESK